MQENVTANTSDALIVFLHIPKTAGTSLSHLLNRKFSNDSIAKIYAPADCARSLVDHASSTHDAIECITGHITYGIHNHLLRKCQYFSMLRNPVTRVISHYNFSRTRDANIHPLGEVIEFAQNNGILEYLHRFPAIAFEQINILSGVDTLDRSALQIAKNNISSQRITVGLTEDFFLSTEMIFQELSLGYPRFSWKRKNSTAHINTPCDQSTLSAIEEYCALDIELYQHARNAHAQNRKRYEDRPRAAVSMAQNKLFRSYCSLLD